MVTVHNFSYGLLNPVLGYAMSCLGAFLGLRCVTRARAHTGAARARWLILAAVSLGAAGIWAMHFVAMLGFTIPGQTILYNVPITIASMLIAIIVVGIGLFIVAYGNGGWRPLFLGGVIVGIGVAGMHYLGMAAMSMPDTMRYNVPLLAGSVVIAIVAGTAALWAGTQVRGIGATIGASLIMGFAVSGMHYVGMAAMQVYPAASKTAAGSMAAMGGATAVSFLVPLLAGISLLTFALTLTISLSPTEAEIREDAVLRHRMDTEFSGGLRVHGGDGAAPVWPGQNAGRVTSRQPAPDAFTPGGYTRGDGNASGDGYAPGSDNPPGSGYPRISGYVRAGGYDQDRANGDRQPVGYRPGPPTDQDRAGPPAGPLPTRQPRRNGSSGEVPPRNGA